MNDGRLYSTGLVDNVNTITRIFGKEAGFEQRKTYSSSGLSLISLLSFIIPKFYHHVLQCNGICYQKYSSKKHFLSLVILFTKSHVKLITTCLPEPLLQTWINFDPSMDAELIYIYYNVCNENNYPFPNLSGRWSIGMQKYFHPTLYWRCDYLSMLRLKLIHVSKKGPMLAITMKIGKTNCD